MGTLIPIVSEREILERNPDYLLILPWHFRDFFLSNPAMKGCTLVFPLPELTIAELESILCTSIPLQHRSGASLVIGVNGRMAVTWHNPNQVVSPVIGVGRQDTSRYVAENESFTYQKLDIADTSEFVSFLNQVSPTKFSSCRDSRFCWI